MAPEEDFGGGGGGAAVSDAGEFNDQGQGGDVGDGGDGGEGQVNPQQGQQQEWQDPLAAPVDQNVPALTPEQWMQVQQAAAPQQQSQQQMTPEQVDEMLKVYNPNEQLVDALFGEHATAETRLAAFKEMVGGIVGHLTTVMGYSNDIMRDELTGQFSPALDMVQEQKEKAFTSLLQDAYPALKGQDAIIRQVTSQLKQQGFKPTDGLEAGRVVAGQVESLIQSVNPNFSLANGAPQQQGQQTNMPQMAGGMASAGGGGAAGAANGRSGGQQKKPSWQSVFD